MAVQRAHSDPKKGKKLNVLADTLVDAGLDGDVSALKEIGDRLDGKAAQSHTGPDGGPIQHTVSFDETIEAMRSRVRKLRAAG